MSNKAVTAASVLPSATAAVNRGIAGVAITAGQVLYLDNSTPTRLLQLASANAATIQVPVGIAVNSAAAGQPINYVSVDPAFTPGYPTSVGETIYISETPGALCPYADLVTGDQPVVMLLGIGTSTASLQIIAAGVKK